MQDPHLWTIWPVKRTGDDRESQISLSKVLIWVGGCPKFDKRVGCKYKTPYLVNNLTEFEEPITLGDNATDASGVDVSHELP